MHKIRGCVLVGGRSDLVVRRRVLLIELPQVVSEERLCMSSDLVTEGRHLNELTTGDW
jgi:hypothetical protein